MPVSTGVPKVCSHYLLLGSEAARVSAGEGTSAGLAIPGRQAAGGDGGDGNSVDTGDVAVKVTVVVSLTAITARPNEY